jgi:hypothetical protein
MDTREPRHSDPFGREFLAEARRLLGAQPMDYAELRRVEGFGKAEILRVLRERYGASYADIQRLQLEDDPRALARYLFDAHRRQASALAFQAWLMP